MRHILLDNHNEILVILNSPSDGTIEREVPSDYPEFYRWSAADLDFVEASDKIDRACHNMIDGGFSDTMRTIVSDLPGQSRRYEQKHTEAKAYKANGDIGPMLEAEASASGMTVPELADEIIAKASNCDAIEISLEAARMAAKRAVTEAVGKSAKFEAAAIDWQGIIGDL